MRSPHVRRWGVFTCCRGGGQAQVGSNGVAWRAHHSTLITPFTITATYFPKRAGPTITTATQMKWIIVSLCGTSGTQKEIERERERETKGERGEERRREGEKEEASTGRE